VDGTLKVLDFGIARLRDAVGGSEHATRTGTLMGTPAFMAPEQAQAVAAEIDGQTDLWAVGATMYTLLSGQLVHDGDNSSQLLIRAGTTRARPLLSVVTDVEPKIAEVVDRALTFEKAGRWANAQTMRDALATAASMVYGSPPGRDVLVAVLDVDVRRSDLPQSSSARSGGATPRLVVKGSVDILANDPTFANPAGSVPPPHGGPVDPHPRTSASPSGPRPALPGVSTANPVSAEFRTTGAPKGGATRSRVAITLALGVAGAAVAFAFVHATTPGPTTHAGAPSAPASVAAPPPSATSAPSVAAVPTAPPEPAATAAPPPSVEAVAPPKPTKHATSGPPATPKAAATAAVDCSTPYTLDSDGNKKWKLECVQH
jgi:serine/threonine protein kinase